MTQSNIFSCDNCYLISVQTSTFYLDRGAKLEVTGVTGVGVVISGTVVVDFVLKEWPARVKEKERATSPNWITRLRLLSTLCCLPT